MQNGSDDLVYFRLDFKNLKMRLFLYLRSFERSKNVDLKPNPSASDFSMDSLTTCMSENKQNPIPRIMVNNLTFKICPFINPGNSDNHLKEWFRRNF